MAVAEQLEEMLVAQGTVFFNTWGLSCPFLFSEDILAEISAEKVTTIVNRSDIGHIL